MKAKNKIINEEQKNLYLFAAFLREDEFCRRKVFSHFLSLLFKKLFYYYCLFREKKVLARNVKCNLLSFFLNEMLHNIDIINNNRD